MNSDEKENAMKTCYYLEVIKEKDNYNLLEDHIIDFHIRLCGYTSKTIDMYHGSDIENFYDGQTKDEIYRHNMFDDANKAIEEGKKRVSKSFKKINEMVQYYSKLKEKFPVTMRIDKI